MKRFPAVFILGLYCCCVVSALGDTAKDYHDQDLKNKDFTSASLNAADFSDAVLTGANFSKASLKEAKFKGATIQLVSFQAADLSGADLRGTAGEADYGAANLSHARLDGLSFVGFGLGDCKCRGTSFRKTKIATSIFRCDFREADFRGANLRGATIDTRGIVQWTGAIYDNDTAFPDGFDPKAAGLVLTNEVDKANPEAVVPAGKDFHDQDLKNKDFSLGSLNAANFSDAMLTNANFSKASLKGARFKGASIQGVSFQAADLTGADLSGTVGEPDYRAANLTNATLQGLTFKGFPLGDCNCRGTNFRRAKIAVSVYRCDFRDADFRGANLRVAIIDTRGIMQWKGAIYDESTAFPDDFKPDEAGMIVGKPIAIEVPQSTAAPAPAPLAVPAPVPAPPESAVVPATPAPTAVAPVVSAAEAAPQPLVAEKGDIQLSGLYLQISSMAVGGRLQFAYYHYYFLPDGHVFNGVPPGGTVKLKPTAEDLAALVKAAPKNVGVYKVTGDSLTIQYPGGKPQTDKASIQKNGDLSTIVVNGAWATLKGQFKDNQTFDARYATTATIKAGGDESHGGGDRINVSSLNTLDFHADGTFTGAGAVNLGVTTTNSHSGSGTKSADHGKYAFSGNTLTMTHADGKTESLTTYPIPDKDESPPTHININGVIYAHEKGA